jgi:metal-sulfur cluster biosynthetic enzyme
MMQPIEKCAPHLTREAVFAALRGAYDPVYAVNVVELGLIWDMTFEAEHVIVHLLMPHGDAVERDTLLDAVATAMQQIPGFHGGAIHEVTDICWDSTRISPHARQALGLEP